MTITSASMSDSTYQVFGRCRPYFHQLFAFGLHDALDAVLLLVQAPHRLEIDLREEVVRLLVEHILSAAALRPVNMLVHNLIFRFIIQVKFVYSELMCQIGWVVHCR